MIIKITNLSNGVHCFNFDKSVEDLKIDDLYTGSVSVKVTLDKSMHQIILDTESNAKHKFICDRCNKESESDITCNFQLVYLFSAKKEQSDDNNVKFLSPDIDKIDISEDLSEYLRLSLPMKNLCSEDCKGLCPNCGTDLNLKKCRCKKSIDTGVWDALKKLKENSN